jgi:hypothetical protein
LDDALASNPQRVLLEALRAIMLRLGGFGPVVAACCQAQRALAHEHRVSVFRQGWIVGKAEDPNK